jgi:hypothetical protein
MLLRYGSFLEQIIEHVPNLEHLTVHFQGLLQQKNPFPPTVGTGERSDGCWSEKVSTGVGCW